MVSRGKPGIRRQHRDVQLASEALLQVGEDGLGHGLVTHIVVAVAADGRQAPGRTFHFPG